MTEQTPLRKSSLISDQEAENITRVEELAYEIKVQEVMTPNPITMTASMKMQEVLEQFRVARISGAPIVEEGQLIGIISIEDLIRCLIKSDLEAEIQKYMTRNPFTVKGDDPVVEALKMFVSTKVGRLPVVNKEGLLIGILTKGDITRGLLKALQQDYQTEEVRRYRASHLFEDIESERTSLILRYNIKAGDFTHGGEASSKIKRALSRMGASPQIARRCGIATYEAEMNLIIHTTEGGVIRVEIEPHQISIDVYDSGPGIKDVELAMKPGYSTASEKVRELGFGAGMGLVNISRCVDIMKLESVWGKGTRLRMKIFLKKEDTVGEGHAAKSLEEKR
ncbi:predicted transcriptional regulator, contains C-terminal CBS domains [Bellilinea caldifistulae]|uniref:CBS domain-containing protein n=1 Tax=Bellilinea caldifistulae TaxID=360411 RepID=UPI0007851227|nr:CBS domain-containing protein [Bellilinea caldifistulae]GAP11137.1 predicted transcriptional regulator, contains C-terminal CBS domains [Bellilinea caldifistulae]